MNCTATAKATPSQEALRDALTTLMAQKPLARIAVKELCAAAHVSRSTFYAYYDNTDELLREVEGIHLARIAQMNEAVSNPRVNTPDDMRFYDETIEYVQDHARDFGALLVSNPSTRFVDGWKAEIKDHLRRRRAAAGATPLSSLTEEIAASAIVSATTCYLQDPSTITPCDVHVILAKALAALDS